MKMRMSAFAAFGLSMALAMSAASAETMKVKVKNNSGIDIYANSNDEVVVVNDGDHQVVSWKVDDCIDDNEGVTLIDFVSEKVIVTVFYKLDKDGSICRLKYDGENKWSSDYDQTYKVVDDNVSEQERELTFKTK